MISLIGHIRRIPQAYDKRRDGRDGLSTAPSPTLAARGEYIWSGIWVYGSLSPDQVLEDDSPAETKEESTECMEGQSSQVDNDTRATPQQQTADGTKRKSPNDSTTISTSKGATTTVSSTTTTTIHSSSRFGSVSTSWLQKIPGSRPFLYKFQQHLEPQHVLIPSENYYTTTTTTTTFPTTTSNEEKVIQGEEEIVVVESRKKTETMTDIASSNVQVEEDVIPGKQDELREKKLTAFDVSYDVNPDDSINPDTAVKSENQVTIDTTLATVKDHETEPNIKNRNVEIMEVPQQNHIFKKEQEITFATMGTGESFTDAGMKYPKRVPVGGSWKGYFENESKRKDRNTSHVAEIFYLFLNASPSLNARVTFPKQEEDNDEAMDDHEKSPMTASQDNQCQIQLTHKETNEGEPLESGLIHVRGTGSNQFGIFEILGSFNIETGILYCQRIYVFTTADLEGPFTSVSDSRHVRKLGLLSRNCPSSLLAEERLHERNNAMIPTSLESKTYFTRKRPVSFKRYNTNESGNEEAQIYKQRNNSMEPPRKKLKAAGDLKSNLFSASFQVGDRKRQRVPSFSDASSRKVSSSADVAALVDNSVPQHPTDEKSPPIFSENSMSVQKKKQGLSRVKNSGKNIILPPTGDPTMARWRAAHFLYYQKIQDSPASNDMPSNACTPFLSKTTTVNYVVYEGEMYNEMRDGVGVCSYNNQFIYEGQWKNNKEHGFGTLLTSDRSRTIYTGEWERGKLNGKGTYNYYVSSTFDMTEDGKVSDTIRVGVYEGDFRENIRTGIGKYTFSDGSFYFGDWMNNVPTGRGTFQWPDGSTYEGSWRDGKRHGQGLLKSSDRFLYDGQWVNNAMEGRGIAIYPHGTRYEGSWLNGKREGRGTLIFREGAIYEGRFKDDNMDGQGTLQLSRNMIVPSVPVENIMQSADSTDCSFEKTVSNSEDWMIPIAFQSDISSIHQKAGFTHGGD